MLWAEILVWLCHLFSTPVQVSATVPRGLCVVCFFGPFAIVVLTVEITGTELGSSGGGARGQTPNSLMHAGLVLYHWKPNPLPPLRYSSSLVCTKIWTSKQKVHFRGSLLCTGLTLSSRRCQGIPFTETGKNRTCINPRVSKKLVGNEWLWNPRASEASSGPGTMIRPLQPPLCVLLLPPTRDRAALVSFFQPLE